MICRHMPAFALILALRASSCAPALAAGYDPLQLDPDWVDAPLDLSVVDAARDREIPVRIYLPSPNAAGETAATPVVLFSHGLGGARETCNYLGRHWAARGYAVVFLQHPGSDDAVWKDQPPLRRMAEMRKAATGANFFARVKDVPAVLDQLDAWNAGEAGGDEAASRLAGRFDLEHVGMSGHSFGAVTTQAVAGQSFAGGRVDLADARIDAALAMSPSAPRRGDPADAFGHIALPWLLMTGTHDASLIGGQTVESRQQVFPALPPGDKFQLVLEGAEHSAFTARPLPGDRQPRNPNHHRAILAVSTAFWDAYLRDDATAAQWLQGAGPRSVLEDGDTWESK